MIVSNNCTALRTGKKKSLNQESNGTATSKSEVKSNLEFGES